MAKIFYEEMKRATKNKKGFTIIELIAVITILALLVLVAIPSYSHAMDRTKISTFNATVKALEQSGEMHVLLGGGDAIWSARAGDKRGDVVGGAHEGWFLYFSEWPTNPMNTGDFVIEIRQGVVSVSPGKYEQ